MTAHSEALTQTFLSSLRAALKKEFSGCKEVAVKLHFGEIGNKTALTPEQVKPSTNILSELGISFFLYDTSVAYTSGRSLPATHKAQAKAKGWGQLGRIVIDGGFTPKQGEHFTYEVGKPLGDADGVLVISHVKGHACTGFGGAIKNLGMGALSKTSKRAIHAGGEPKQEGACEGCKACEEACPLHAITVKEDGPHIRRCYGCSNCSYTCPSGYLAPKVAPFDELLADGARAAASTFKKQYYVNLVENITKVCDCMPFGGELIADDCGYVHGGDMAGVDRESHRLVMEKMGKDVFLEHNLKTGLLQVEAVEKGR